MRKKYLVVVPPARAADATRFHELDTDEELAAGDEVVVAHMHFVVQAAVDVPADDEYDATLLCAPREPAAEPTDG